MIAFFLLQSARFGDHCGDVTHNPHTQSTGEKCLCVICMYVYYVCTYSFAWIGYILAVIYDLLTVLQALFLQSWLSQNVCNFMYTCIFLSRTNIHGLCIWNFNAYTLTFKWLDTCSQNSGFCPGFCLPWFGVPTNHLHGWEIGKWIRVSVQLDRLDWWKPLHALCLVKLAVSGKETAGDSGISGRADIFIAFVCT